MKCLWSECCFQFIRRPSKSSKLVDRSNMRIAIAIYPGRIFWKRSCETGLPDELGRIAGISYVPGRHLKTSRTMEGYTCRPFQGDNPQCLRPERNSTPSLRPLLDKSIETPPSCPLSSSFQLFKFA